MSSIGDDGDELFNDQNVDRHRNDKRKKRRVYFYSISNFRNETNTNRFDPPNYPKLPLSDSNGLGQERLKTA